MTRQILQNYHAASTQMLLTQGTCDWHHNLAGCCGCIAGGTMLALFLLINCYLFLLVMHPVTVILTFVTARQCI